MISGPMLDEAHSRHPALPIAVSEYGAGGSLTQHTDDAAGGPINPHGRPHPEEIAGIRYHEASWNALRDRGYLWGVYIWNMFDFFQRLRAARVTSRISTKRVSSATIGGPARTRFIFIAPIGGAAIDAASGWAALHR